MMNTRHMRCLVMGNGPVGHFLTNRLSANHALVTLKSKQEKISTSKRFDYIFVTTKTYDHVSVVNDITYMKKQPSAIILCHNGKIFDKSEIFKNVIDKNIPLLKCVVNGSFSFHSKLCKSVRSNNITPWAIIGPHKYTFLCAYHLNQYGIPCISGIPATVAYTKKLIINSCANILSCIYNSTCKELVDNPQSLKRVSELFYDTVNVLRNCPEHKPAFASVTNDIDYFIDVKNGLLPIDCILHDEIINCIREYGDHYPSTHTDFNLDKKIEIDTLNGFIVSLANLYGIRAYAHESLINEIKSIKL